MINLYASEFYRWGFCPGSLRLTQETDESLLYNPVSEKAELGTLMHKIAEDVLKAHFGDDKLTIVQAMKNNGVTRKHEEYDKIKYTVDYYVKEVKKYSKNYALGFLEKKEVLKFAGFRCVAKSDFLAVFFNLEEQTIKIKLFDLKTGNWNYESDGAMQLWFSALIFVLNNIQPSQKDYYISADYYIIQPNYYDENYKTFVQSEDLGLLYDVEEELGILLKDAFSDKCNPGSWCNFCKAIAICPAQESLASFSQLAQYDGDIIIEQTIEKLETLVEQKPNIEKFLKAAEEKLKEWLEAGHRLEKHEMGKGFGRRRWVDEKKVKKKLKHLGDDLYEPRKLKTPAQLEKIAGKENIKDLTETPSWNKLQKIKSDF